MLARRVQRARSVFRAPRPQSLVRRESIALRVLSNVKHALQGTSALMHQ